MSNREAINFGGLLVVIFAPPLAALAAAHLLVRAGDWLYPILMGWLR